MFFLVDRGEAAACPLLNADIRMTYTYGYVGVRGPLFEIALPFSGGDFIGKAVNSR
ncbi:hypothetical protein [Rhizobium viscosum]|uniref:Uncharacterized protein n=1 Tax=Rhizobium viscosum TaxID=1673 RepID=A0ABR9IW90_RHIVS|nr:hypothetical protein [Rhizobium viscosum]MBE1507477.1 hypothetical protein [Rhizobium viscosum]